MVTTGPESTPRHQIDPQFRARCNALFDSWQSGVVPFHKISDGLRDLKHEALAENNPANQGAVELISGIIQGYRGNLDESIVHFERARELFEASALPERVATCTLNIGESYRLKGSFPRARRYFQTAYEVAQRLGSTAGQVVALTNEGQTLLSMGDLYAARQALEEAASLSQEPWGDDERDERNRLDNLCEIYYALSAIFLQEGQLRQAWEHARKSYDIATRLSQPLRLGYANRAVASVISEMGESPDPAFENNPDMYFDGALAVFREVKAEGELARTFYAHGRSLLKRGDRRAAARKLQQATVIFSRLGMADDAARAADAQLGLNR